MGAPAAYTALFMSTPAHNLTTMIPSTMEEHAGVAMGVASGTVLAPATHLTVVFAFRVGRAPTTRTTRVALLLLAP
jgi:predicted transporter